MRLLQLHQLESKISENLKKSFDDLPHTTHRDGQYRLRKYSTIMLRTTFWNAETAIEIERMPKEDFIQSESFNKHQGGMIRKFEDIDDCVLKDKLFKEACLLFKVENRIYDNTVAHVHQMRILAGDRGAAVAPEGIHQDGYQHIAMISMGRENVEGGAFRAYLSKTPPQCVMDYPLDAGKMLFLDDKKMWHFGTKITKIDKAQKGYLDLFVLCADSL